MRRSGKHPAATDYAHNFADEKSVQPRWIHDVYSLLLEVKDRNAKRTDGISPGLGNRYGQRAIRRPSLTSLFVPAAVVGLRSCCGRQGNQ